MTNILAIRWQPDSKKQGARVLRVYSNSPELTLPAFIEGLPVTEIGPYCFAASQRKIQGESFLYPENAPAAEAVCGSFLEKVILPDTVTTLHNAAFYNCRKLHTLSFSEKISSIGSDEFTNCRELKHLILRSAHDKASGLKILLERIETDVYVHFQTSSQSDSLVFFPEYYEWLDEITPAHLFSRSINGEGYRMRKAFRDKIFDYEKYDQCFTNALATESDQVLCEIALWRLRCPLALSQESKALYHKALTDRKTLLMKKIVKLREEDLLHFLFTELSPDAGELSDLLSLCSDADWAEGLAIIMGEQAKRIRKTPKTFSFDDIEL